MDRNQKKAGELLTDRSEEKPKEKVKGLADGETESEEELADGER